MVLGRVKWFNKQRGFGYITILEGEHKNSDVFAHYSSLSTATRVYGHLYEGEFVNGCRRMRTRRT